MPFMIDSACEDIVISSDAGPEVTRGNRNY